MPVVDGSKALLNDPALSPAFGVYIFRGLNGGAEMSKRQMAAAVLMAVTISVLGVVACIGIAKLLVPFLLAHADRSWFLPVVLCLSVLSTFSLVFYGKHRAKP